MSYTKEQIREAISALFSKYDTDGSQIIDKNEALNLIKDVVAISGCNK